MALARSAASRRGHRTIVDYATRRRQPQREEARAIRSPQRADRRRRRPTSPPRPTAGARRRAPRSPRRRERIDPVELDAATDRDARHACLGRPPGDAQRGLAEAGLGVDPALAGDDEVGAGQPRREVGRLHHQVDAGTKRERPEAARDREQGEPDTARGAGARRVANAHAGRRFERIGPGPRAGDRARPRRRGCALLRPVDRRRAGCSQERVRHVAGDRQLGAGRAADPGRPGRRRRDRGRPWRRAPRAARRRRRSWRCHRSPGSASGRPRPARPGAARRCRSSWPPRRHARAARRATGRMPRPSRGPRAARPRRTASAPGSCDRADP